MPNLSHANHNRAFDDECLVFTCQSNVPAHHGFPLCDHHLKKAWAAFEVANGADVPEPREPYAQPHPSTQRDKPGVVYFIRIGEELKIGWTSNIKNRSNALQADAVLHVQPGTQHDEHEYHQQFNEHRTRGKEWFALNEDTQEKIQEIISAYRQKHLSMC